MPVSRVTELGLPQAVAPPSLEELLLYSRAKLYVLVEPENVICTHKGSDIS